MKIQITAKTVSDAIDEALIKLDTTIDCIEHRVIQEPSKGFLGFGTKPAIIEVWVIGEEEEKKAEKKKEGEKVEKTKNIEKIEKTEKPENNENTQRTVKEEIINAQREPKESLERPKKEYKPRTSDPCEDAKKFLGEVFDAMKLNVEIETEFTDNKYLNINLKGSNMGVIIGKRGQTLDSLQYLVNLCVNKGEAPYISVTLDTEQYRKRRKETLENLAYNLAKKAKHIRKNVVLEPMSPYERRIIHSTLQNDRYVTTYSEGEEPFRYVVIALKKYNV